jgi:hypothetical protein
MTTAELFALVARRWYVVLAALAIAALVVLNLRDRPPVYWTEAEVTLVNPRTFGDANELTGSPKSLISMAGLVVADVEPRDGVPAVSDRVDLPGLGVRDGWMVRLPNQGGQWEPDYSRPVVDVQVVAPTPARASSELRRLVEVVRRDLDQRQASDGVAPEARMRASASLDRVRIVEMSGSRTRASVMVLLLGSGGGLLGAWLLDAAVQALRSRRSRRSERPAAVVPDVAFPHVPAA